MYWLFGMRFSLDAYLSQPECSREGLGLPIGQGALHTLRTGGGGRRVSGGAGGKWEEGRK